MASSMSFIPLLLLFILFNAFFVRGGVTVGQNLPKEMGHTDSCISRVLATCTSFQLSTSVKADAQQEDSTIFEIQKTLSQMQDDLQSLKKSTQNEIMSTLSELSKTLLDKIDPPQNCADLLARGDAESGVRTVYPFCSCKSKSVTVFCDQETDGGGWTVIQRRDNLTQRENFDRNWNEYVKGFGNISGEFWLGLDAIHALVSDTPMELRVDLEDFEGERKWAKYEYFSIDDAATKYLLHVGGYSGDAVDALERHDGQYFTSKNHCAQDYSGGWWFDKCLKANLNGLPGKRYGKQGIVWEKFRGEFYVLNSSSMMVRPRA